MLNWLNNGNRHLVVTLLTITGCLLLIGIGRITFVEGIALLGPILAYWFTSDKAHFDQTKPPTGAGSESTSDYPPHLEAKDTISDQVAGKGPGVSSVPHVSSLPKREMPYVISKHVS